MRTGYRIKGLARIQTWSFEGMNVRPLIAKEETEKLVAYHIRVPPRTRVPHSYHKIAVEIIYVLAGRGIVHLNRRNYPVKVNDSIFVRPGVWHSFSTQASALTLLAMLSPRVDSTTDLYHR